MGALKLAKKVKILGAVNSKRTIANAMHKLRSFNRSLVLIFNSLHRGAFLTIFVRISTDKQNTWIFGNFSDQLDEILKDSCDLWRFLEIFGLKV